MDAVIAAAVGVEQADLRGPVEQRDAAFAGQPAHRRKTPLGFGVAHRPQHINIDKTLEQMQQRQNLALVVGERGAEAIGKRCAERF